MRLARGAAVLASSVAALIGALSPAALAAPVPPARAARLGPAPPAPTLQLVLALPVDRAGLARFARAVSTPGSAQYGSFETIEQLARRFGASSDTRRRVLDYLRTHGVRSAAVDVTGLFIDATMSTIQAERLFATPLERFRSATGARYLAPAATAASAVTVPTGLRGLLTGVIGLDTRLLSGPAALARSTPSASGGPATAGSGVHALTARASSARARSGTPAGCAPALATGGFTPNQYLTAYGYDPLHNAGLTGQGERVALIEIDGFRYSDVESFASCFGLSIPALSAYGVGVSRPLAPGGEATLDLEVLDSAAPGLRSIDVYEAKPDAAETLRALTAPLRSRHRPQIISASLGLCEPELLHSIGVAGIRTTEAALQMAAASGITVLAASGDQGSADCTAPDGSPLHLLAVNYPASSWWATGVGGTNLVLSPTNQIQQQLVWNDGVDQPGSASGGGSSVLFGRPGYQRGTVRADRRAVPDISALADIAPGYAIFCTAARDCISVGNSNPWQTVGGTSAGTPLLAGGLALIDQELRLHQRDNLGLVNQLLYSAGRGRSAGTVFSDVTSAGNDVGGDLSAGSRPLGCCTAGRGFDRASGWGSVELANLAALAIATRPPATAVGLVLPRGQSPVRAGAVRATVSCSGACRIAAYAVVTIGRDGPFEVDSGVTSLRSAGQRTLTARFSSGQLRRLRSALAGRRGIRATVFAVLIDPTVYGVLPDPGRSVLRRSAGLGLTISR